METCHPIKTLADLKTQLEKLTPEQLQQPVRWSGEMRGGTIDTVWVLSEDHINPSGDGLEPVSAYDDDDDLDLDGETRTPAGTVLLLEADSVPTGRRAEAPRESRDRDAR